MAVDMRGQVTGEKIATGAINGATHIQDGTVQSAKVALSAITATLIADNAVTSAKIGPGAIETSKVSEKVRTRPVAADDTEVDNSSAANKTVYETSKTVTFAVKNAANATPDKVVVALQVKTSDILSAATAGLFMNSEVTARSEVSTNLLTYDLVTVTFEVGSGAGAGQLAEGTHSLKMKLKSQLGTATATIKLVEVYHVIL